MPVKSGLGLSQALMWARGELHPGPVHDRATHTTVQSHTLLWDPPVHLGGEHANSSQKNTKSVLLRGNKIILHILKAAFNVGQLNQHSISGQSHHYFGMVTWLESKETKRVILQWYRLSLPPSTRITCLNPMVTPNCWMWLCEVICLNGLALA